MKQHKRIPEPWEVDEQVSCRLAILLALIAGAVVGTITTVLMNT